MREAHYDWEVDALLKTVMLPGILKQASQSPCRGQAFSHDLEWCTCGAPGVPHTLWNQVEMLSRKLELGITTKTGERVSAFMSMGDLARGSGSNFVNVMVGILRRLVVRAAWEPLWRPCAERSSRPLPG